MLRSLVVVSVLAFAPHADAKCARIGLEPVVLTPASTAIPADGGVVVAAEPDHDDGSLDAADPALQKEWAFRSGKTLAAPTIDHVAPGLAIYRGSGELVDGSAKQVAPATRASGNVALLAAPKVKQIFARKVTGRRASSVVEVTLDGATPASAVALVAVNDKGKPISFGSVIAGDTLVIYRRGRCGVVANGTVEPTKGMRVTVFWVDAQGRRSPASRPITIAGETTVRE